MLLLTRFYFSFVYFIFLLLLFYFCFIPCSFLMCLTAVLAFLAEIKFRNQRKKRPNFAHVVAENTSRKTYLKVHRKKTRKFPLSYVQRKLVYFAMTRELILRKIRLRNILLCELFCWLFLAPLGAVLCQFSETTWANNSSEFPLFPLFPWERPLKFSSRLQDINVRTKKEKKETTSETI